MMPVPSFASRTASNAPMPWSRLNLQLGFWTLVFALRQLPGTLAEWLTGNPQWVFNLMWAAAGLVSSALCDRWLIRPGAGGGIARWRWVASAALVTLAMLSPGVALTLMDRPPMNIPGAKPAEMVGLFLAMRSADAMVPAVAWCMGCAATIAVARAASVESRRLALELELERQAKLHGEFRLGALQARVHPHFLFNAMNTIRALIADQPDLARRAVTDLAFLMRRALNVSDEREQPVEDELKIVEAYLAIEQLRFGERLRWRVDDRRGGTALSLPPLLLQTLVENAVVHGVGRQTAPVLIEIRIAVDVVDDGARRATIEVVNSGSPRRTDREDRGPGRGLSLSRERLRLLYGAGSDVQLIHRADATHAIAAWTPAAEGGPHPDHRADAPEAT